MNIPFWLQNKEIEPVTSVCGIPVYFEGNDGSVAIPETSLVFYEKSIRKAFIGSLRRGVPMEWVYVDAFGMIHFQTVPIKLEDLPS